MSRRTVTSVLAVLSLAVLASCSPQESAPAESSAPSADLIIPPTTKVLDAAARSNVLGIDAAGTLRFAPGDAAQRFAPNDVVVSEPFAVAPYGLLRKVTNVRTEPDGTIAVETVQARLVEAIHEGHLHAEVPLDDAGGEPGQGALTMSQAKQWTFHDDFGSGGKLVADGSASLRGSVEIALDISCDQKKWGICWEIPDLNFKFMPSVAETANLRLVGKDSYALKHDWTMPVWTGNPSTWTFWIGPVPVTIVPSLIAVAHTNGSLSGSFEFTASQSFTGTTGFSYNSDANDLVDLTTHDETLSVSEPTFSLDLDATAGIGLRLEVSLYGIGGGFGEATVGPHVIAHLSGTVSDPDFLWNVEGCFWTHVGLQCSGLAHVLEVIDGDAAKKCTEGWGWEPYSVCFPLLSHTNNAPFVSISSPLPTTTVYLNAPTPIVGRATDVDSGDVVTCRWSAKRGDTVPADKTGPTCDGQAVFASLGYHTLTLTGVDNHGRSSSTAVTVNVVAPPAVYAIIDSPADGQTFLGSEAIRLSAHLQGATAAAFSWTVVYPTDAAGDGAGTTYAISGTNGFTWTPKDTLPLPSCTSSAYAKLVVTITDTAGRTWEATRVIRITPPIC